MGNRQYGETGSKGAGHGDDCRGDSRCGWLGYHRRGLDAAFRKAAYLMVGLSPRNRPQSWLLRAGDGAGIPAGEASLENGRAGLHEFSSAFDL